MSVVPLASPAWLRALTLSERVAWLGPPQETPPTARGRRRADAWRETSAEGIAGRLAAIGLTEDQLVALLDTPDDADAVLPGWLTDLAAHATTRGLPFPLTPGLARRPDHGFLHVAAAMLGHAWSRLVEATGERTAALLFEPIALDTLNLLCRPMVLELTVARLQGALTGDTPRERFERFVERFRDAEAVTTLFEEWPVLARVLTVTIEQAVDARLEAMARLSSDRALIAGLPGGPAVDDPLVAAHEAGDPHRGGRVVLVLAFSSGARLVYKPKSLAVDLHLQELLGWLGDRGFAPGFRPWPTLDRGDYGWQAFLANEPCEDEAAVGRYYRRTGGLLAVLHVLAGTDVHFENLVAVGEHPALIDAETLFHPGLLGDGADPGTALVNADLAASVLGVGLLPERTHIPGGQASVDLSGLGASGDQVSPQEVTFWQDAGLDTMRLARRRMPMPEGEHAPKLGDRAVGYAEHADQVVAGFLDMARLISELRAELLAENGPLAAFSADPVRVILRPTQRYAVAWRDSTHPDLLRDALDRDRYLDRLWRDATLRPELAPVVHSEQAALQWGDIPVFVTTPASRDLMSGDGETFVDFLPRAGMDVVRARLAAFDEAAVLRQLWYVSASLSAGSPRTARVLSTTSAPVHADTPLAGALAIADRLEQLACRGDGFASWVGESTATDGSTSIRPVGCELYGGVSGIALFLAALDRVGGARHRPLLDEVLATLRAQVERRVGADGIGAFTGWSGPLWAMVQLAELLGDPSWTALAEGLVPVLAEQVDDDDQVDVIGGSAGCLLALLALHDRTGSPEALAVARRCGERLLATVRPAGPGVGWVVPGTSEQPLGGMAHGVAGIALALHRLSHATDDPRFAEVAAAALLYERTLVDAEGRWSDLRSSGHDHGPGAWCHGAPGIGLARLASGAEDARTLAEIEDTVARTLADGFAFNQSLCHGSLGNLELVASASRAMRRADWSGAVDDAVRELLAGWADRGPTTGVLGGLEAPGLMTGLAGIGYGLLRVAAPDVVPSVLVLASRGDR
ncbi:MAG: type 2 lantipeptide synthetase LanM [Alphaproteobacteria bacterium]|nr:type 2 lantipeptide synthetase LanM [Alphaproteobacteria bacterium]MCB9698656.1 type 2 lantipeptide synthetase LanM [Alphaproteobacteria bacterium]